MDPKAEHEAGQDTLLTHGVLSENPEHLLHGAGWRVGWAILHEALLRLWNDDAIGLAGNVAFRALLAIFPFLIFASSLTAFVGSKDMADDLVTFLIAIVPPALVEPLVSEVMKVLTVQRGGLLSIGGLLTIWFAVGGVDGVRVGLNRAYGMRELRSTLALYALEVVIVIIGAMVFVLLAYVLVLAPTAGVWLHSRVPDFDPSLITVSLVRYPAAAVILMLALFLAHALLPARRLRFANIWPGVLITVMAWSALAAAFSYYLRTFAMYASYYAGLAGIIAALYFMYLAALALIFGGELNRAIRIWRLARALRR